MFSSKPEQRPPTSANAMLSQTADLERKSHKDYEDKNAEIRAKIASLEEQIKKEEQLARKIKGDQTLLKNRQA